MSSLCVITAIRLHCLSAQLYVISVHYTIPPALLKPGESSTVIDWTVSHRYSDFEALRSKLVELSTNVPALPGKSWFGSLSSDLVNTRKVGLTTWLAECVSRPWILEREEWKSFLCIDRHVPPAKRLEWTPLEIKQVRNTPIAGTSATYGVNDLIYLPSALVLLLGMEEQRLLTKLDNTLSSLKLPWEKDGVVPRPLPLGTIRIHKVDAGTGVWKTMCSVPIAAGVVCLAFDEETRTVCAGLDDGALALFRIDPRWEDLEPLRELRTNHESKARVTAIVIHNRKHWLLSAARDKCLSIYDLRKEQLISSTVVGASVGAAAWVSALELDEDADLAFLGTYSQHIHIYDLSSPASPKLLHTLEGHTGSVRCMQYRPAERYLFSGGYEGWAGIWSINSSSREAVLRSRSVGWLKDGANEKVKSVLFIPPSSGPSPGSPAALSSAAQGGLVVIGQDAGYLCFFSVSTGLLRYATKAHASTIVKLVFIEDASVLISAGLDGVVRFWSIPTAPMIAGESDQITEASSGAAAAAAAAGAGARRKRSIDESSGGPRSPAAAGSASAAASPSAASASSSSYTSSPTPFFGGPQQQQSQQQTPPRKSTASSTAAPPPSVASGHSVLHKSSRADSQDGTTFTLPSSFADREPSASGASFTPDSTLKPSTYSTRTSFFQEDDGDLHTHGGLAAVASSSGSSLGKHSALLFNDATSSAVAARNLFDSDDAPAPAPKPSAAAAAPSSSSLAAGVGRVSISEQDAHAAHASGGAVEIPHEEEEADIF